MSASASAATAESRRRPYIPRRRPSEGTSAERKRLNRVSTESGASDDVDHDEEDDDIPICPSPFRTEYAAVMQPEQPNNFGRPRRRRGPCLRVGWCTVLQVTALAALAIANWFFVQPGSSGGYHPDLTRISSSFSARASPPPRPAHAGAPPATPSTDAPPPAAPPSVVAAALDQCPPWAPALGFGGAAVALIFSSLGSAYGTGKAATGVSAIGVHDPGLVMKMLIPVVMAGVLGIYGLIIAVTQPLRLHMTARPVLLSAGPSPVRLRAGPSPVLLTALPSQPAHRLCLLSLVHVAGHHCRWGASFQRGVEPNPLGLLAVHGRGAPRRRPRLRAQRRLGGHRHWDCWRRGRAGERDAAKGLCRNGTHPHLRGGARPLRSNRRTHPRRKVVGRLRAGAWLMYRGWPRADGHPRQT